MQRKTKNRRQRFLQSSFFLEGLGLGCIFLALFTALALYSYSGHDPSWFTASQTPTRNLVGIVGAYWSSLLLQFFGATSFLIVILFGLASVGIFRRISKGAWALALLNYFFLLLSASAFLAFVRDSFQYRGAHLLLGGAAGDIIKNYLSEYLNFSGAALATFLLLVLAISLSTKLSVATMGMYLWWGVTRATLWCSFHSLSAAQRLWARTKSFVSKVHLSPSSTRSGEVDKESWIAKQLASAHIFTEQTDAMLGKMSQTINQNVFGNDRFSPPLDQAEKNTETTEPQIIALDTVAKESSAAESPITEPSGMSDSENKKSLLSMVGKAARANDRILRKLTGNAENYEVPPANLLRPAVKSAASYNRSELLTNSQLLEEKIRDFKVQGSISAVKPGPVITIYEFKPGTGVKVNSIANLADDLALALSAQSVRIEAPIPGRDVVGIEVPNTVREDVFLKEIIESKLFREKRLSIPIAIGKDTMGEPVVADLKKMPHMLVAGATGSGKSVFINGLICSLLYRFTPSELKLILVDPKQLELAFYDAIPHLLLPVVTDAKHASLALRWAVHEMERRYQLIARSGMRDIDGFNQKLAELGQKAMAERLALEEDETAEKMPKIVIVIDELADLMMTAKADVENNICRLAQKARAAGIHLVLATQRPSVDVITGLIKANLPARISFRLSSKNDSRTIFDTMGAERLCGNGDMLFMPPGESRLLRMHGAYISEQEIESITDHWRAQGSPEYREDILVEDENDPAIAGDLDGDGDSLFTDAVDIAITSGIISASMLQRRFRIGYNRAARLVEAMEAKGIVGPADGSRPRPVLIQR